MTSDEKARLYAVIGLSAVVIIVLVGSVFLALRRIPVPSSWETLSGAAVGSLGTLVVASRGAAAATGAAFDKAVADAVARSMSAGSQQQQQPSTFPTRTFTPPPTPLATPGAFGTAVAPPPEPPPTDWPNS